MLLLGLGFVVSLGMGWTIDGDWGKLGETAIGGLLIALGSGLVGATLGALRASREGSLAKTVYGSTLGAFIASAAGGLLALAPDRGVEAFAFVLPSALGFAGAKLGWFAGSRRGAAALGISILGAAILSLATRLIGISPDLALIPLGFALPAGLIVWCVRARRVGSMPKT
jgi:hypothetical protein